MESNAHKLINSIKSKRYRQGTGNCAEAETKYSEGTTRSW